MNIFILDMDMIKSIQYLPDKHVVKMPLESTQLLCGAYYTLGQSTGKTGIYKATHLKHPCSVWTAESLDNWLWLQEYTLKLGEEYTYRYGKKHKSVELAKSLIAPDMESLGLTEFAKAVPEEFKDLDVVDAYRQYFIKYKNHIKTYTNRDIPSWWV